MNNAYLLDTNAAIALLNANSAIEKIVEESDEIFVPIIVIGELYYGAEKSGRAEVNLRRIDEFASRYTILFCDLETAREYGRVQRELRAKGRPIQPNDMWIAAIARQHQLTVMTKDTDFNNVNNLSVQGW
jgi:tRNA(fMet)-specific endonuclease VapC